METDTHAGRRPCADKGRERNDASARHGTPKIVGQSWKGWRVVSAQKESAPPTP
jgi:hypothetical protein